MLGKVAGKLGERKVVIWDGHSDHLNIFHQGVVINQLPAISDSPIPIVLVHNAGEIKSLKDD
jgi:hypothetical protein